MSVGHSISNVCCSPLHLVFEYFTTAYCKMSSKLTSRLALDDSLLGRGPAQCKSACLTAS